jgi:hypothetical protein
MATQRQIDANRKNARHSTGPRTAAGIYRSSRNAIRHGLTRRPGPFEHEGVAAMAARFVSEMAINVEEAEALAQAQAALNRIEIQRLELQQRIFSPTGALDLSHVEMLETAYDYEHRAKRRRRREFRKLFERPPLGRG